MVEIFILCFSGRQVFLLRTNSFFSLNPRAFSKAGIFPKLNKLHMAPELTTHAAPTH